MYSFLFLGKSLGCDKTGHLFWGPFSSNLGVIQGDIILLILFNLVVDAVIRAWEKQMDDPISALAEIDYAFYANDGKLGGWDTPHIQQSLDIFTCLFSCVGLWMNAKKTQAMITKGCVEII